MPGHKWGIQVPNGQFNPDDVIDIYANGVYKLMQAELIHAKRIKERAPECLLFLRMYLRNWYDTDPKVWARECGEVYRQNRQYIDLLTWANEQNLSDESGGVIGANASRSMPAGHYQIIRDWNLEWIEEFRNQPDCKDAKLAFPGLAYGHSDDQNDGAGIGLDILRPVIEKCRVGNIHLYVKQGKSINDPWEGLGRLAKQRPFFLGKQIIIGETGHFEAWTAEAPAKYLSIGYELQRYSDILGFCFFIHADPTKAHQQNDMSRNHATYDAIKAAERIERPIINGVVEPNIVADIVPLVKHTSQLTNNHNGVRPVTRGVVIHSTRGNSTSIQNDYTATINWFFNPASRASSHFVVGPSEVCRVVNDANIAWHAVENNQTHLGIELAQPRIDTPYTDFQYEALADIVKQWAAVYKFPLRRVMSQNLAGLIGHEDTEQGKRIGKTDPGPKFDWNRFLNMVNNIAVPPVPPTPQEIEQNALAPAFKAAEFLFKVGTPRAIRAGHAIQSAIDAYKFTP